ncbi:hypothetical protein HHI36_004868 [Cryptolaemus montrouzieri]|uniref:Protein SMG9 n=1 Tax=Cryptolaemus montrouzieri TaxID=559131 RepID=A0ABD2NSF4_9CUCU
MSQHERGRTHKKKFISKDTPNNLGRSFFSSRNSSHRIGEDEENKSEIKIKQPTILLKTREQVEDVMSSPKRAVRETEATSTISGIISSNTEGSSTPQLKCMNKSVKFLDDGILYTENLQDFTQENSDFIVVGIIGQQGVGKSTIANLLASKRIDDELLVQMILNSQLPQDEMKSFINRFMNFDLKESMPENKFFSTQNLKDVENNRNRTNGIDIYINDNRVIFLDCQPFLSMSIMDDLVENENKRSNLVSEFIPSENSGEIQGLQMTSFLISVCHILVVVQDWFFDSNICR